MVFVWRLEDMWLQQVCRPGWFVFRQCGGRSGWHVGAAAPELEVCSLRCVDDMPPCLCGFFVSVFLINRAMYGFEPSLSYKLGHFMHNTFLSNGTVNRTSLN
jgi:hypothetical protein